MKLTLIIFIVVFSILMGLKYILGSIYDEVLWSVLLVIPQIYWVRNMVFHKTTKTELREKEKANKTIYTHILWVSWFVFGRLCSFALALVSTFILLFFVWC